MPATITKSFSLRLGLATSNGKLTALRVAAAKKAVALTTLCPTCVDEAGQKYEAERAAWEKSKKKDKGDAPTLVVPPEAKIAAYNACEHHHAPEGAPGFKAGECRKGYPVGEGFVPIDGAEVKAVKVTTDDAAEGILDLTVHAAADVAACTQPGGTLYWYEPAVDDPFFASLASRLNDPTFDKALCGIVVVKGEERFVRLVGYRGGIVVQELSRPQELENVEKHAVPSEKIDGQVGALIDALVEDFDAANYRRTSLERIQALIAEKIGAPVEVTAAPAAKADPTDSLLAALEASVQAARAAKAA